MADRAGHRSDLDEPGTEVLLPAEGYTVGTSLDRRPILVAHTGQAHIGIVVDRRLRRRLERAYRAASASARQAGLDDLSYDQRRDPGPVIPFRRATAHDVRVSGGAVHLTLHAVGERGRPDVHVELRLDPALRP
jgi:hypothetical protein